MSRHETFIFEGFSVQQETRIKAIAQGSKSDIHDLMEATRNGVRRGRLAYVEALAHVYELSAKLMCDWRARQEIKLQLSDLKEWKTSSKLTNCLVRNLMGVSRQMASKYSATIDFTLGKNVSPEEFAKFVKKSGGVEEIYRQMAQSRKEERERGRKDDSKEVSDVKSSNENQDSVQRKSKEDSVKEETASARAQGRSDALASAKKDVEAESAGVMEWPSAQSTKSTAPECSHIETADPMSIYGVKLGEWVGELFSLLALAVEAAEQKGSPEVKIVELAVTQDGVVTFMPRDQETSAQD